MANPNIPTLRSIEAMKREIESQLMLLDDLELAGQVDVSRCTMTGSGDSYVAASIASYLSNCRIKCCYPSTLIFNPEILIDRELYIISISGRTAQNILAAKLAKKTIPKQLPLQLIRKVS